MARADTLVISVIFVWAHCFGVPHVATFQERKRPTRASSSALMPVYFCVANEAVGERATVLGCCPFELVYIGCLKEASLKHRPSPRETQSCVHCSRHGGGCLLSKALLCCRQRVCSNFAYGLALSVRSCDRTSHF